jgi:hypothetical protein
MAGLFGTAPQDVLALTFLFLVKPYQIFFRKQFHQRNYRGKNPFFTIEMKLKND